jgi:hypothetical protein
VRSSSGRSGWQRTQPAKWAWSHSNEARQLIQFYADRGSPKYEPAARQWLVRYLSEGTPSLKDVAKVAASLAKHKS